MTRLADPILPRMQSHGMRIARGRVPAIWLMSVLGLVLALAAPSAPAWQEEAGPTGVTLDNGLTLVMQPSGEAGDSVTCWLRVEAGSAYEHDDERGAAHLAEHLGLTGPAAGQLGHEAVRALRIPIGEDRNAYTSVDHVAYWVSTTQPSAALAALATVLQPQPTSAEALDRERDVVINEWINGETAQTRAQQQLLAGLFPGTALAERWPSVPPAEIAALAPEAADRFRTRTHHPAAATLVVVGPIEPTEMEAAVRTHFAGIPVGEPASMPDVGAWTEPKRVGVVRVAVEGLDETEITLAWPSVRPPPAVDPAGDPTGRVAQAIAVEVMRSRLGRIVAQDAAWQGSAPIVLDLDLPLQHAELGGSFRLVQLGAQLPTGAATQGVEQLAGAAAAVASVPLTALEVTEAIDRVRARVAARAAQQEGLSGPALASRLAARAAGSGAAPAATQLAELDRVGAALQPIRVSAAAAELFDPERAMILVQGPPDRLPTSTGLLARYRLGVEAAVPGTLLQAAPIADVVLGEAAQVQRVRLDPQTGVLDAELDNGIRIRHHQMSSRDSVVQVRLTLASPHGPMTLAERDLARIAARALTERPDLTQPWAAVTREPGTSLRSTVRGSSIDLVFTGPAALLEQGTALLAGLTRMPRLDDNALARWADKVAADRSGPRGNARSLLELMLTGGGTFAADQLVPDPSEAGAYFQEVLSGWPVLVTVVGPVAGEQAIKHVAQQFAAHHMLEPWPANVLAGPPTTTMLAAEEPGVGGDDDLTKTDTLIVRSLAPAEAFTILEIRALVLAARTLEGRMQQHELLAELGVELELGFDPESPSRVSLVLWLRGSAADVQRGSKTAERMLRSFSERGPTLDELETARAEAIETGERVLGSVSFWSDRLARSAVAGSPPGDIASIAQDYARVTAVDCRDAVGACVDGVVSTSRIDGLEPREED